MHKTIITLKFFAISLVCFLLIGCSGEKKETSFTPPAGPPNQQLQAIAKYAIESYGGSLVKYASSQVSDDGSGNYNVIVTCKGEILSDHKGTVAEYEIATKRLAKDIYSSGHNINVVGLDMICPVVNKNTGANTDLHAWGVFIRKDKATTVKNWDTVDLKKLVGQSDYKIHSVLK